MIDNNFNPSESKGLEALASIRSGQSPSVFTDNVVGENRLSQLQQEIKATGARLSADAAALDKERRELEELERKQRGKSSVATINLLANNYSSITESPTLKRKFEKLEDGGYAHKSNPGAPAFFENNGRIELQSSEPEVIKDLVQVLHEHGVRAITIEGGAPEVNDRLWLQASLLGMQVHGYTPENPAIHSELEQLRAQLPKPNFWDKTNLDPDYHAIVDEYNEKLQMLASDLRSDPGKYAIQVDALGAEYGQKAKEIAEAKQASQQEVVSLHSEKSGLQTNDVTASPSDVGDLKSIKNEMEKILEDSHARIKSMDDADKLKLYELVASNARKQMDSLASDTSRQHPMDEAAKLMAVVNSNLTQIEAGTHAQLQAAQRPQARQPASSSSVTELPTDKQKEWMKEFVKSILIKGDNLTSTLIDGMNDADRLKFLQEVKAQQKQTPPSMAGAIQLAKWTATSPKSGERVIEDGAGNLMFRERSNDRRTLIYVVPVEDLETLGYTRGQENSIINRGATKVGPAQSRTKAKL